MRTFLLLCSLVTVFLTSAQEKVLEKDLGWDGFSTEVHSITDKNQQQVCTIVMSTNLLKAYLTDTGMIWKDGVDLIRRPDEQLYGGFFRNGRWYIFLGKGSDDILHVYIIDPHTNEIQQHMVPFKPGNNKIIDRVSCGDHFLFFAFNKKNAEFVIYDFITESEYATTRHQFKEEIRRLISASEIQKVDDQGDCNIEVAASHSKLYVKDDSLFLLINKMKTRSVLYRFSLSDQKVDVKTFSHDVSATNARGLDIFLRDNAYLLDNKLYYVYATTDSLGIHLIDVESGKVIKRFFVKKNQEINFKNTPIIEEGTGMYYTRGRDKEIEKTSTLLRKMGNGGVVVSATLNNQQQVELSVGSYTERSNVGSYSGGRYVGSPVAGVPGMWIPTSSFNLSGKTWINSARFKMLLDRQTLDHLEGEMESSISEKIEAYTKGKKISSKSENVFVVNNRYYYTYYDRKEKKLCVIGF